MGTKNTSHSLQQFVVGNDLLCGAILQAELLARKK